MKNLIPYFIQEKYQEGQLHGSCQAYTMFVDLSGFTPLTEALMKRGVDGSEVLSIILNRIFDPMVCLVYRRGGFIPYFAGDAFTAIFPKTAQSQAWEIIHAAQELRSFFNKKEVWNTRYGSFKIGVKIGLSVGQVEWGIIGDDYKAFYFRGDAIDNCAQSEHCAQQQEIIIDTPLFQQLPFIKDNFKPAAVNFYKLEKEYQPAQAIIYPEFKAPPLSTTVAKQFLLDSVIKFNQQGEFRSVVTVFISFTGVEDHDSLNEFASIVVNQFHKFSGYFKEIDFGDKGGVLVGFFGAPVSFENNAERALELATTIENAAQKLQKNATLQYKMGITAGVAYTGIVGGKERCQYAAVGNQVNLAARLMSHANWGEILVNQEIQKTRHFNFKHTGDIQYKGIQGGIPTYLLTGRNIDDHPDYLGKMIGREKELISLQNFAQEVFTQHAPGISYIYGEAGIGKSRISYELKKNLQKDSNVTCFTCQADQILQKPFNPFVYFLKNYFEQSPENSKSDNRQSFDKKFQQLLNQISLVKHKEAQEIYLEISRTRSVLAAQIGIKFPDSLWEQLDAKGKYQNTLSAIITLFKAESMINPLLIELEDGHWFDESSIDLVSELIRQLPNYPTCILVTSRYADDGSKPSIIRKEILEEEVIQYHEIDLNILHPDVLLDLATSRLGGTLQKEFFKLLERLTNGNPFYAEQLLEYFSESDLLIKVNDQWILKDKSIRLSSSINSILMARIDRLSDLVKETVKAAAVIGREFELPVLTEVMNTHHSFAALDNNKNNLLREQIITAEKGQIWRAMNELRYIFKHSLLREAVYDMQLRTRLREVHFSIAKAIEKVYADNLEDKYLDLSFHYEQADKEDQTIVYTKKAAIIARKNFQNKSALQLYNKLIRLLENKPDQQQELINALLRKADILELIGQWQECETVLTTALQNAKALKHDGQLGKTYNSFGHLLILTGQYTKAKNHLEKAIAHFEANGDEYGLLKAYGNLGNQYFRQGQYRKAEEYFIKSIELSKQFSSNSATAQIVANLGLTYMNLGDFDAGIRYQKAQLEKCQEMKDKPGMAILSTNLGIVHFEKGEHDAALDWYQQGLELSQELGNKQLIAITIGCIGSVYERKGDYEKAMYNFEKDLEVAEELGDKQGIAITLGLIGQLHTVKGEFDKAIQFLERQLAICRELNYQKGIAKAVNTLGDIYHHKTQSDISIKYYDLAIDVARKIDNKLVLGESLVEKGNPLLAQGKVEEAQATQKEALKIAKQLGNPNLIFEVHILGARVTAVKDKKEASFILKELLLDIESPIQKAALFYELYQLEKHNDYKQNALQLYQKLYNETPQFIFKQRIQHLILGR